MSYTILLCRINHSQTWCMLKPISVYTQEASKNSDLFVFWCKYEIGNLILSCMYKSGFPGLYLILTNSYVYTAERNKDIWPRKLTVMNHAAFAFNFYVD